MVRSQLRPRFLLDSPGLDGNGKNFQCHDESGKSHADGEGEHGVEVVVLDRLDHVTSLEPESVSNTPRQFRASVQLTLSMKTKPPEIRQNAAMISVGGRDGRYEVGGLI